MTFSIKFDTAEGSEVMELEDDVTQPIDWFISHCQLSERGETLTLLKDGVAIDTYIND